jgi:hypothetical protein
MADDDVVLGPPESWAEFADRCQRQLGRGARVFLCRQMGVEPAPPPILMVLSPGHDLRPDLLAETMQAGPCTHSNVEAFTGGWRCRICGASWPLKP